MSRLISLVAPEDDDQSQLHSQRALDRLVAFSDAVVAIAITLVMLPLVDVAVERDATMHSVFSENGPRVGAAALTFAVIGSLWREHHSVFGRAVRDSRVLIAIDLVWLASVVFLPVPTALLLTSAQPGPDENSVVGLYTATAAVAGLMLRLAALEIQARCSAGNAVPPSRLVTVAAWSAPSALAVASVLAYSGLGTRALLALLIALPLQWAVVIARRVRRSH